ncbi:phage protein, partial [Vibrio diabolicus]
MSFDVDIHGSLIHVEKATVSITDDSQAAQTRGVPDDF